MQFGHFDDRRKEYVITNPDTPQPWINYLGTLEYGAIISNNATGYSFIKSGYSCRLLRARFNATQASQPGRFIYVRDRDSGDYWTTSWMPVCKPQARYKSECRHGTGYTIISSRYGGIATETTYYVPRGKQHEVWACTVINKGKKPRKLSLFTYAELTNHNNAFQDMDNLQYSEYISRTYARDGFILQSINEHQSESGRLSGVPAPGIYRYVGLVGAPVVACDGSREAFIGSNRSYHNPIAVERGRCSGAMNYCQNSTGSLQADIELEAGASATVIVVLGLGGEAEARAAMAPYAEAGLVDREVDEVRAFWHSRLQGFEVKTPDPLLNTMVNVWNAYECFITFSWARAASMVYTGERNGWGYRDAVQDIQGIMHLEPKSAGERLRFMLSGQLSGGGALPLVRYDHVPGTLNPNEDKPHYRCDDMLWVFPTVDMYVKESGDTAFLDETIPYADAGSDTVYGHLRRALDFSLEHRGEHGLLLGLDADWNDCIRLGKTGETTFASFQFYWALQIFARYADMKQRPDDATWAREQARVLMDNMQKHAWEGDRYVRAFSSLDNSVIGSKTRPEGSLFLNPQAWAVISGAVDDQTGRLIMDTVNRDLATDYGVMLCHPAFKTIGLPVMRCVLFLAGVKENAGIFCHPQGWAVLAEAMLGRGNRAWQYYNACNPARMNDKAEVREIEPYVHSQFIEGRESPYHGRSHNPWLTGTASTVQVAAVRGILGVQPEIDGLRIDPSIPSTWDGFTMRRVFRGKALKIRVKNPDHVEHGVKHVVVNGKKIAGAVVPAALMRDENSVEVVMG